MRAVVFRGKNAEWFAHIQADNNEIVFATEGHHHRTDLMSLIKDLFPEAEIEVRDEDG